MSTKTSIKRALAVASLGLLSGCSTLASKGAVVGCQAADASTTLHAMELGARERNPVVAALLNAFGPTGFVLAKLGATLLLVHVHPDVPQGLMALANGITCGAAVNNAKVIRELKPAEKKDSEEVGRGGEI